MKKNMSRAALALALFIALTGVPLPVGAADFEPFTFDQVEELVRQSRGKVVMINFFATWCPPCREEVPSLIRIRKDYGEDKLVLIGASVDEDDKELRKYVDKMKFNYPIRKAGQDLVQAAGVTGIPHMLVFDRKGEVVGNAAGLIPEKDLREFIDSHLRDE